MVRRVPFNARIELLNILTPSENGPDPELPRTVASEDVAVKVTLRERAEESAEPSRRVYRHPYPDQAHVDGVEPGKTG